MAMTIGGLGQSIPPARNRLKERRRAEAGTPVSAAQGAVDAGMSGDAGSGWDPQRTEVTELNAAVGEVELALAVIEAADAGLVEVDGLLSRLEGLIGRALKRAREGPAPATHWVPVTQALGQMQARVQQIALGTRFGGLVLLDGRHGFNAAVQGAGVHLVSTGETAQPSPPDGFALELTQRPAAAGLMGPEPLPRQLPPEGLRLLLRENGRRARYLGSSGLLREQVPRELNTVLREAGLALEAGLSPTGQLWVRQRRLGAAHTFEVQSRPEQWLAGTDGVRQVDNGADAAGRLQGQAAQGDGPLLHVAGLTLGIAADAPLTGVDGTPPARVLLVNNALRFSVAPGQDPLLLRLDSLQPAHLGRGVLNASGFAGLDAVQVRDLDTAEDALWVIIRARAEVGAQRTRLHHQARAALGDHLHRLRGSGAALLQLPAGLGAPQQALQAAELLKEQIRAEAVEALWAQANPPKAQMLRLLQPAKEREERPRV